MMILKPYFIKQIFAARLKEINLFEIKRRGCCNIFDVQQEQGGLQNHTLVMILDFPLLNIFYFNN